MFSRHFAVLLLPGALALGCGGGSSSPAANAAGGYQITIANMAYSPLNLDVPAGATVTVINEDNVEHSVTSESAAGQFVPGSVAGVSFDTGSFTGMKSFVLPASAAPGTKIPYYCTVHKGSMATPDGTITVQAAPPQGSGGSPGMGSTPGGGYGY